MLIEELLGREFALEDEMLSGNVELQKAIDDILLVLRKRNHNEVSLSDIANELRMSTNTHVYINPNDPEFKSTLIDTLQRNDWVEDIVADTVRIKRGDDISIGSDNEAGDAAEAEEERRKEKVNKIASKDIRDKANKSGGLE